MLLAENDAGQTIALGDDQALAEAIERLKEQPDKAQAWGHNALRAVLEQHSVRHRCKKWERLLEDVMGA